MCFIAAGMGGGTGTGAAPVIAKAARDKGMLTVGVVTKPFSFEGNRRGRSAEAGIDELQQHVDTLIVIPNQNLFRIANPNTTFKEAFKMADEVLQQGVRGITDLMVMPGLINLDFADVRSVMGEMGKAMMGTGEAVGDNRAIEAAEKAIANPLLDGVSMKGAKGVIISITGGEDMRLMEVDEAANHIKELVDPDANIIWGSAFNNDLDGKIRVSVVATGIDAEAMTQAPPLPAKVFAFPRRRAIEPPTGGRAPRAVDRAPEPDRATLPRRAAGNGAGAERPPMDAAADELMLDAPVAEDERRRAAARRRRDARRETMAARASSRKISPTDRRPAPPATRSWIDRRAKRRPRPTAKPAREGGTLFERMSNIARGAAKAQVEEEPQAAPRSRDPLDIPRFLGRQNNQ